jgi:hypothetical protein
MSISAGTLMALCIICIFFTGAFAHMGIPIMAWTFGIIALLLLGCSLTSYLMYGGRK